MDARRAWVLNLDAELELEAPNGYHPSAVIERAVRAQLVRLAGLVAATDVVVWPGEPRRLDRDFLGECWCSTPSALRRLRRAGVTLGPRPALEAVRAANHRRFQLELGVRLPGAAFVETPQELERVVAGNVSPLGVVCKRPFSHASRNARRLSPHRTPAQMADDDTWLAASLATGGLWVEPWVEVVTELSMHGVVDAAGEHRFGVVCVSTVAPRSGWRSARLAAPSDVTERDRSRVQAVARDTAAALQHIGYFGPFGIDAFTWRDGDEVVLHALGDVNARYTMAWALGMGASSP